MQVKPNFLTRKPSFDIGKYNPMSKKPGWIKKNTFHHSDFSNLKELVQLKEQKKLKISLAFPTLNEEKTIGKEIALIRKELYENYPLLDEIAVIDSGSTDSTLEIARENGALVFRAKDILPHLGDYPGKGENLWKSLYVLSGDIIVWLDADIKNIHPKFVYGLVGPLLKYDHLLFVKAFYQRPMKLAGEENEYGGGRVTEILVRPLLSLFFPELAQLYQPCSGECAGRRELLERLPFACGYGIETGMLLDIYHTYGPEVIAQANLDLRIHRNQPACALGKMGFEILHAFLKRIENLGLIELKGELSKTYRKLVMGPGLYKLKKENVQINERPPIIEVPEYLASKKSAVKLNQKNLARDSLL